MWQTLSFLNKLASLFVFLNHVSIPANSIKQVVCVTQSGFWCFFGSHFRITLLVYFLFSFLYLLFLSFFLQLEQFLGQNILIGGLIIKLTVACMCLKFSFIHHVGLFAGVLFTRSYLELPASLRFWCRQNLNFFLFRFSTTLTTHYFSSL